MAKRLKEILLGMHQDEDGKKILRQTDGHRQDSTLLPGGEEMVRRKLVELYRPRHGNNCLEFDSTNGQDNYAQAVSHLLGIDFGERSLP